MNRQIVAIFSIVSVVLLFSPVDAEAAARDRQRSVTVQGEATLSAKPDLALVSFGAVSQAAEAASAIEANNRAMRKVLSAIEKFGIPGRDVQTGGFLLNPQYESGRITGRARRIIGYSVQNWVIVKLRDISRIGEFLGRVMNQGANRFRGVHFALEQTPERMDRLRKEAVKNAAQKARILAESAGANVGKVLEITEGGANGPEPRPMFSARALVQEAVPIAPGESGLRISVTVVFEIH